MGEPTISQKALEDAMLKTMETILSRHPGTTNSTRGDFYNDFQRAADEHDSNFVKKCGGDLDTTLIFAGLFSAVTSAFIIDVQAQIQPDYTQLSFDIFVMMAKAQGLPVPPKPSSDSPWSGPDPTLVHVQSILYSTLAVSLLAAFIAMLGKQWLTRYSADIHGSLIDRSRDRQRKMNGISAWGFNIVMESLPMMLQGALLLLGYALYTYLSTIDTVVAWVIAAFTASGVLFYGLIVVAAILSYDCPFQTPLSIFFHFLVRLDNTHGKYRNTFLGWFRRTFLRQKKQRGPAKPDGDNPGDHIELAMVGLCDNSLPLWENGTDYEGYVLDSNCITWMSEKTVDEDVALDIMKFIPEVVWHAGIRTTPMERLYDTLLECFDCSSGRPVVIPKLKKKAYLSAKALLHIAIQRKCISPESDKAIFETISSRYQQMGSGHYRGDSDLESTLGVIDRVFKPDGFEQKDKTRVFEEMPWNEFFFDDSHHAWLSRILLDRAFYVLKEGIPFPDEVRQFVLYSLRLGPPPPPPIVLDCLLIIGLVLGIRFNHNDQQVIDKSKRIDLQIDRIYSTLSTTLRNPDSTTNNVDRALEALRLIAPLSEHTIATKSYDLFHVVMQTSVSLVYTKEKKWEASRLALHGAYKWDKVLPWVDDPQDILTFLEHHFKLAAQGENQDEPIQNGLRALAYAFSPITTKALRDFNPTQPTFVRGINHVFQKAKPEPLRKAALFLLPLIDDKWFNTPDPIMEPNEMKTLCENWASAVDDVGFATQPVQKAALAVLFGMMNSPHWRPHIVKEKWKLLEHFNSVPEDSEPLKRCIENSKLIQAISEVGGRDATSLWSTILWLKYNELIPEVRKQLEQSTRTAPRSEIDQYLRVMDSEWIEAEDELTKYTTWSMDEKAIALRDKIENVRVAKEYLTALKRG